jgi:Cse1
VISKVQVSSFNPDTDTRRRASADLVRGLLEMHAKEVTEIFSTYITQYLDVEALNSGIRTG